MSGEKKSFLMFYDSFDIISELSDEQAGKLLKAIFDFCINRKELCTDDSALRIAFKFLVANILRCEEKYEKTVEYRDNKSRIGGIVRSLKAGNRLSKDSVVFLSKQNIGKEYLRKQGVSEETIQGVWNAIAEIEENKTYNKINCHKTIISSTTKVIDFESED